MGLARSTYYDEPESQPIDEARLIERIKAVCAEWPAYGYRRVTAELREAFDAPVIVHSTYEQTSVKELVEEFPDLRASLNTYTWHAAVRPIRRQQPDGGPFIVKTVAAGCLARACYDL
jgi:hypothetical protein